MRLRTQLALFSVGMAAAIAGVAVSALLGKTVLATALALAGIGLVGLFYARTLRSLNKSLRALQAGTARFSEGKWDPITLSSRDELGDLAKSFNDMAKNIRELGAQTIHMHRMSAVGQLAGGVAHEINNPLTGVLGQAQLLLAKMPPNDPHRPSLEKIERAALRCRQIVRSLLDFSRQKESLLAPVDLAEAVRAALELCEPDLQGARVAVVKDLAPSLSVSGNAPQLQQVFLNIVANAIHAMPKGGTLMISSRVATLASPPREAPAKTVEVSFKDTGIGIDPQHIRHVFEPFFTTKEIGKGTGLGLSVSLGIIKNHGGDIQAESPGSGAGACFRVLLPLMEQTPSEGELESRRTIANGTNPRY